MGPGVDKLFLELAGRPVIAHTWQRYDRIARIDEIILVVRDGQQTVFRGLSEAYGFRKPYRVVAGDKERQDSVWNGLQVLVPGTDIVAIQDGARPCTSEALVLATIEAAREHGAAVAAQRVTDTVKASADGLHIAQHLDRSRLWTVQTPQTFRVEVIRHALAAVRERGELVTDDTAACELIGQTVVLVPSSDPNPKITTPEDLPYVGWLLDGRRARGTGG